MFRDFPLHTVRRVAAGMGRAKKGPTAPVPFLEKPLRNSTPLSQAVAGDRGRCHQTTKPTLDAPRGQNDYRAMQQNLNCQPRAGMKSCKHSLPSGRVTSETWHRLSPRLTMMFMHADNCFRAGQPQAAGTLSDQLSHSVFPKKETVH